MQEVPLRLVHLKRNRRGRDCRARHLKERRIDIGELNACACAGSCDSTIVREVGIDDLAVNAALDARVL